MPGQETAKTTPPQSMQPQGFDTGMTTADNTSMAGAQAREMGRIQAALVIAQKFRRDEQASFDKIMRSCSRPTFAERARYVYPRGGQNVEGPSVNMAREMARAWGNLDAGYRVTDRDDQAGTTTLEGWAWDLESNTRIAFGLTFENKIWRGGQWRHLGGRADKIDADRDYLELVARNGAKAIRNSILQIIPADVVEESMDKVRTTIVEAAKSEADGQRAVQRMVVAFRDMKVSKEMLEAWAGCGVDEITAEQVVELKGIWRSIHDGQSKAGEYFHPKGTEPGASPSKANLKDVSDKLDKSKGKGKPAKPAGKGGGK